MTTENLAYTPTDICKLLGISRPTVDRLLKKEGLPHLRFGEKILIPKADFNEWLESKVIRNTKEVTHGHTA